jgi:hypothetical protein
MPWGRLSFDRGPPNRTRTGDVQLGKRLIPTPVSATNVSQGLRSPAPLASASPRQVVGYWERYCRRLLGSVPLQERVRHLAAAKRKGPGLPSGPRRTSTACVGANFSESEREQSTTG